MIRIVLVLLGGVFLNIFPPATLLAMVDMKNANYIDTWTDIEIPGSDMAVEHTYSSRSLFNGIFGFGRCSDFETSLTVIDDMNLKITICGGGPEIIFSKKGLDKKSLVAIKESNKKESFWFANGQQIDQVRLSKNFYYRTAEDGSVQKFSDKGRLLQITKANNSFQKLIYRDGKLSEVVDDQATKFLFEYWPDTNKVKKIIGPKVGSKPLEVTYTYKNDDLIKIANPTGTYHFEYDDLHNLVRSSFPKTKDDPEFSKVLTYDKDRDWITSFKGKDNCLESYKYVLSKDDPVNHYTSSLKKVCNGKVVGESRYEFWYKTKDNKSKYLHRVVSTKKDSVTDITYHPIFGRPLIIERNKIKTTLTYFPNGLVKTKESPEQVLDFRYDSGINKISSVKTTLRDEKGKALKVRTTEFRYNNEKYLIHASNSEGQKVVLKYDQRGRIMRIEDQAKKVVLLEYNNRLNKPSKVIRPGLGSITVVYNPNGEIKKVDSESGPVVAAQVAATFNNLLDILAPATNELNI